MRNPLIKDSTAGSIKGPSGLAKISGDSMKESHDDRKTSGIKEDPANPAGNPAPSKGDFPNSKTSAISGTSKPGIKPDETSSVKELPFKAFVIYCCYYTKNLFRKESLQKKCFL